MKIETCQRTVEKVALFRRLFTGLTNAYGTYDPATGQTRVVKEPVTDAVIAAHLKGERPYGVFLLVQDRTSALVVDFDDQNVQPVQDLINRSAHYGLSSYVERSKSKGHHVWMFFDEGRVPAAKARLVMRHILEEIEFPNTEIFPKQDVLNTSIQYGNFINTPLFGDLVPKGRTVFVNPNHIFQPYPNQWDFLENIQRIPESLLDEIIELNDLYPKSTENDTPTTTRHNSNISKFGLPPCAQRILSEGVTSNQRVTCFRLSVHLKRLGIPYDIAVAVLRVWASKNRPVVGNRIITENEILAQATSAFKGDYCGYGCEDSAIIPYCDQECPLQRKRANGSITTQQEKNQTDET